ncbi:L-seryl-tRNA(Sec) kinase-like isoform X2 [Dunckerocampus dactyliophorus]|uniref:L-seryl-tRNA(Sec) kinase-like isoform X2 n=1 Tax=Dunckerocampus dactyliophorus TaxID=161453 RepID=UPI00240600BB|nr:L-seryl-tRNA(Sec) kinase-like isoform X2 [Dunckerocampus dactyliophorus]
MATDVETGRIHRAAVCLCVICGLPAAGKSSLSRTVCHSANRRGWRATTLQYDELIPVQAFYARDAEENTEWKLYRHAVLQCIEEFLNNPKGSLDIPSGCRIDGAAWERCVRSLLDPTQANQVPLLFLLDDNFYYPSMRYEVYQLARKYSLSFCQVYVQCCLESCISRNKNRPHPVPTEVIEEMEKRLKQPNPKKNQWEAKSVSVNATDNVSECDIQRVMELICSALSDPLSPVVDDTEQKEADRQKCATSVVHRADQACRRLISEALKKSRENGVPSEHMRSMAAQLNESKAQFLLNVRKHFLQEAPFIREEDLDVEHVMKRAVELFDHDKQEILSKIIIKKDYS